VAAGLAPSALIHSQQLRRRAAFSSLAASRIPQRRHFELSAEIIDTRGSILTLKVAGRLTEAELTDVQQRAGALIREKGRARILVLADGFLGWERGGQWNDFSFQERNDPSIEKMAIVGPPQLMEDALVFVGKGWRPFPIEYFMPGEAALAQAWLELPA
jgi:hypothetical protein